VLVSDASLDQLCEDLRTLITERRQALGLSLNELSKRAGLNRMAISFIERGLRVPSISTYARIAAALGIAPSELLARAESSGKEWRKLQDAASSPSDGASTPASKSRSAKRA
jgi:transcriptional regulator with XRE-family HTH domain